MVDIETQRLDEEDGGGDASSCLDGFLRKYNRFKLYLLIFMITIGLPVLVLILGLMDQHNRIAPRKETEQEWIAKQVEKGINDLRKY